MAFELFCMCVVTTMQIFIAIQPAGFNEVPDGYDELRCLLGVSGGSVSGSEVRAFHRYRCSFDYVAGYSAIKELLPSYDIVE